MDQVVQGITQLGYELGGDRVAPDANWVVSPLSIVAAFSMVRAGAGGDTGRQLDQLFGFPEVGLAKAVNEITGRVVTTHLPPPRRTGVKRSGLSEPPVVALGGALFARKDLVIGKPFQTILSKHYGSPVRPVDFRSPAAKQAVDAWVRSQTAGRIRTLFDHLPRDTKLVLANTVYLKADWRTNLFSTPATAKPFRRADGTSVSAPTMQSTSTLRYASGPGWRAVELPYIGDELVMWILLPDTSGVPNDLLAPAALARVEVGLRPTFVEVSLPRWSFSTTLDLAAKFRAVGLNRIFGRGADFSGIAPDVFIDNAAHRATISVDEWGTDAAAATGAGFFGTSVRNPDQIVRVDHPFAFAVIHRPTGVPIFVGHVADPTSDR